MARGSGKNFVVWGAGGPVGPGKAGEMLRQLCGVVGGESLGNIAGESPECSGFKFCQFSNHCLEEGGDQSLSQDDEGILCIRVFLGLWLKPSQLWQNNLATVLETLQTRQRLPEQQSLIGQKPLTISVSMKIATGNCASARIISCLRE